MQLTEKTKKPKKISDNINRTEDVIAEAQKYAEMIQMLAKGPQELALVDDLYKARDLLRDMNEKQ
ncbi:hypothetical protein, partial [Parvimonas sp. M20]|uniref:hypothetical protein n=1 Tax=Parvimonas sp. M20 TaxID=3110693 RepID=UPI002B48F38C